MLLLKQLVFIITEVSEVAVINKLKVVSLYHSSDVKEYPDYLFENQRIFKCQNVLFV